MCVQLPWLGSLQVAVPCIQPVLYPWRRSLPFPHHFSPKSWHMSISSLSPLLQWHNSQDNPVTKTDSCPEYVCFFNSLATVIYYNSLKWLLRELSFRHHYQVIFWFSPSSAWTPFPWPTFGHVLYYLSPHHPTRGWKVLTYFREHKVLKKHRNVK